MRRKQAIMVDEGTVVDVVTGDRYMVTDATDAASPCEPLADALARHGFYIDDSGTIIVSGGGNDGSVTITLDASDIPQGNGFIGFSGRDGETLGVYVRGGIGILDGESSLDVPRVTFVSMLDDNPTRVIVDCGTVSIPDFATSTSANDGSDYAADLIDALCRLCDALDDGNDRMRATIVPFVCGIQRPGVIAPIDWFDASKGTD